ncbi:MAG TPA: peptide-methionine (R)-S-oxide reductase MsrB [Casimicrobiaceae bacterium]|nr:peptide-methionine (R)-S-oxide reductase MsrB [Casimicrobiaceae bacterium]
MNRRTSLIGLGLLALGGSASVLVPASRAAKAPTRSLDDIRNNWRQFVGRRADIAQNKDRIAKTDEQWRKLLGEPAYDVLRHEGTERPFTSPLNDEHRAGVFVCAGCALPLFTSEMKFDSGTGWPSFFTSIPEVFATTTDTKLIYPRTEYHCVKCEGHHGHVFDDGPKPTGQRWCNNGVALRFIPLAV